MMIVTDWFAGFATIGGFLYFLAGFGFAYLQHCIRMKIKHKKITIPWHLAGIAVGIGAMVVFMFQSSIAYNTARQTALEQRECNIQFRAALLERSKITRENDELSQDQRMIIFNWFNKIVFPPPPYDVMAVNDPPRQQFALNLTIDTREQFYESVKRQNKLQADRDRHVLPDPTCGK